MKLWMWIAFAVTILAQWSLPLIQIRQHETVLAKGTLVKLRCTAPDPYDPLRGRYLRVSLQPEEVASSAGEKFADGSSIYVQLVEGSDGISTVGQAAAMSTSDGVWAKVVARYNYGDFVRIDWPIDRFYVNEAIAPAADDWMSDNLRNREAPILAELRILDGQMVIEDLSLDGKSFRDILREKTAKP